MSRRPEEGQAGNDVLCPEVMLDHCAADFLKLQCTVQVSCAISAGQ